MYILGDNLALVRNYAQMIDWCLTPTLAVFQLCRGMNTFYSIECYKKFSQINVSIQKMLKVQF